MDADKGELLYRRYLSGEDGAFSELLELYFDNLTLFINGYLNDVHASEDVAIESMLVLAVRKKFGFRSSLKTYLFAIGRHKALNYLRKNGGVQLLSLDDERLSDKLSLENEVLRDEKRRTLARAMERLPEIMRSAVHLVYIEGMSYREAARILKKNTKQIDNLLTRAKGILKTELEEEGGEP